MHLFARDNRLQLSLAFALPMLNSAGFFVLYVFMPTYLNKQHDYTRGQGLVVSACALACATVAIPLFARLSDRIGRRPVMLTSCVAIVVLAVPGYMLLGTGDMLPAILASVVLAIAF